MQIPDEIRLGVELLGLFTGFVTTGGVIFWRMGGITMNIGKMAERFEQHGERLDKMEGAIDKFADTLQLVAVQKDQIQSIRNEISTNTKRTDDTFKRIFDILDRNSRGP